MDTIKFLSFIIGFMLIFGATGIKPDVPMYYILIGVIPGFTLMFWGIKERPKNRYK